MTGDRITKRQRQAIKKQRRLVKTTGYREAEKYLAAIRKHREEYDLR